jgi:dolichol-phosphate mannosyltransferase
MCWTRRLLENIELDRVKFVGYAFQIEMKFTAVKLGFNVVEVPIIFTDRTEGTSKMNKSIFREAILGVMDLRLRSIMGKIKPIKAI